MNEQSWWTRYPSEFYIVHGWVCGLAISVIGLALMSIFG